MSEHNDNTCRGSNLHSGINSTPGLGLEHLSLNSNTSKPQHYPFQSQQSHLQSPKLPQSPPVSSSAPQLNDDIKARILAFQQKRTKPVNSPPLSGHPSPSSTNLNLNSMDSEYSQAPLAHPPAQNSLPDKSTPAYYSKPLPATPSKPSRDPFSPKRSLSSNDSAPSTLIPSPSAHHRTHSSSSPIQGPSSQAVARLADSVRNAHAQQGAPVASQTQFELKKKPSLSQRRGMKLNMSDITKSPSTNEVLSPPIQLDGKDRIGLDNGAPLNTTGGLSRRLSERKNKPNFKLNLDSSNSDLPQHRRNDSPSSDRASLTDESANGSANASDDDKKPQLQGLFANYSKYVDIKSGQLNFAGKASLHSKGVDFSSGSSFRISLEDMEFIEELGRGNYGSVSKVLHKPTGVLMAMKEVRLELDESKFTQILMELEILHKCDSPYVVDFYGAFFVEGAVYMCMEYMDGGSLDKLYGKGNGVKDESCLAYITECIIRGLKELKDEHHIIHRDVKPTNILINTLGKVKLCDFGVSGNLVASLAKTNIGCQSYMAPERIKSLSPDDATYSVQSDIWSLGLTILEVAAGRYPYPSDTYGNIFSQLSAIVDGDPPKLDPTIFSKEAQVFVKSCLNKNPDLRPSYAALLNNPWLLKYRGTDPHMAESVTARVKEYEEANKNSLSRSGSSKKKAVASSVGASPPNIENVQSLLRGKVKPPALHKGGLNANRNFLNR